MSLSKPHIDHDNGPHAQNNAIYLSIHLSIYVSIYLSMYHLLIVFVAPWFRVRPEMLCVFWYIEVLACMIYNCTLNCTQLNNQ